MILHLSCVQPGKYVHNTKEDCDDDNDDHNSNNNNKECHNVMLPVSMTAVTSIKNDGHHRQANIQGLCF